MPLPQFRTVAPRLFTLLASAIAAFAVPAFAAPAADDDLLEVHLPVAIRAGETVRVDQLLDAHYELPLDDYLLYEVVVEADVERRKRHSYAEVTVGRTRLDRVPLRDHATAIGVPPIRSTRWQLRLGPGSQAHGLLVRLAPATSTRLAAVPGNVRIIGRSRHYQHRDPFYRGSGWGYGSRGFAGTGFDRGCPDPYHWRHGHSRRWYRSYNRGRPAPRQRAPAAQPGTPIEHRQWRGNEAPAANRPAQVQQPQGAPRPQRSQRARIRTEQPARAQQRPRQSRPRTESTRRARAAPRRAQTPRRAESRGGSVRATRSGSARRVIQ
jgi:hypothetical protein